MNWCSVGTKNSSGPPASPVKLAAFKENRDCDEKSEVFYYLQRTGGFNNRLGAAAIKTAFGWRNEFEKQKMDGYTVVFV